jgi:hypothetical protein
MSNTKRTKTWIEVILMPLAIAIVGIMGTYLITNQQRNADEIRAATDRKAAEIRAASDRQIKLLEIFADKMISTNEEEILLAANLTMAMDLDLALKMMTVFEMTVLDSDTEIGAKIKLFIQNLTSHAIISKLAEGKTGAAYQKTILEGHWLLMRQSDKRIVNWLEFRAGEAGLTVHGDSWAGEVTFDGKHGYYLWEFEEGPLRGKTGRTDFFLDSTGILFGVVKGDKKEAPLDWTYWAIRWKNPRQYLRDAR